MKNSITAIILVLILLIFSGCAGLKGKIARGPSLVTVSKQEDNQSLTTLEQEVLILVGLNLLEDKRPKSDIFYMTSIKERVSDEILKILKDIKLFDEVHFPASTNDNIIISGEIRKFNWESFDTMISYIPGLNVLPFLGLPSTRTHSEVEIYLQLKDNKTNKVILDFSESYFKNKKYNIYNFKSDKANEELSFCFDIVLNRIKEKIILNKNNILEAVKSKSDQVKPKQNIIPKEEDSQLIDLGEQKSTTE